MQGKRNRKVNARTQNTLVPGVYEQLSTCTHLVPGPTYWFDGAFDLVVFPLLLDELVRALEYPKLKDRITATEATELLELLIRGAITANDSTEPLAISSRDPEDNYLIALASSSRSLLVSGDKDLLALSEQIPVYSPAEFLALIDDGDTSPS